MKKFHKLFLLGYGLTFLFMILPIIMALLGYVGATIFGCESFNEGSVSGCMFSDLWYALGIFPWFLFFTVPIGIFLEILLVIGHILVFLTSKKKSQ